MKKPNRDSWLRDVEARQRNVVFPDTAANEARFWRNLFTGKQKLSVAQTIGLAVVAIMTLGLFISITFGWGHEAYTSWSQRLGSAALDWAFAFAFLGGFLLLLKWRTSRK